MKTKIQNLLFTLAGLMWGLSSAVQAQIYTNSYGFWYYSINVDGTCTVKQYIGSGGAVIIPDTINGFTVVNIGDSEVNPGNFFDPSVTKVTIPDSVINIDWYAFRGCTNLTGVIIPDSVTNIDIEAFQFCNSLTNVVIPDSVTSIGGSAFEFCTSLKSVTIGNGVTSIDPLAFGFCTSLANIAIPDSVTSIGGGYFHVGGGEGAFGGCASLASITIGSGVTNIEDYAFIGCPALTSLFFQGNAPTADSTIFNGDNFTNITVYTAPGTTGWDIFASTVGVVTAPAFNTATLGGWPVIFYPPATNTLQMSTNPAAGNWSTVSNAVALAAVQLTNVASSAFFRMQGSGGGVPSPGLSRYFGQLVLWYPANGYALQTATQIATPDWASAAPGGNTFIAWQITNAPPNAVFRLH